MERMYAVILILILKTTLVFSQDRIVLRRTHEAINGEVRIKQVGKDSIQFRLGPKDFRISLKEVESYSTTDEKTKKPIVHVVPIEPTPALKKFKVPDPNAEYIRDHIRGKESYKKEEFVEGIIFKLNGDTINCRVLRNEGEEMNDYLFVVAYETENVIAIYEPKDIIGYMKDSVFYKSYLNERDSLETGYFIKQLSRNGHYELFSRGPIPSDPHTVCLLKTRALNEFYFIMPETKKIEISKIDSSLKDGLSKYIHSRSDQSIETTLNTVLKSCKPYASINRAPDNLDGWVKLIQAYNDCH